MEPVNDVQYKQCAVIKFLFADKQSMKNIHKRLLCNVYGSAVVNRSTIGHKVDRVMASETRKVELPICVLQVILSQLLVLKYCRVLMPLLVMIIASQLNNWHSFFQSKSHHLRSLIFEGICKMVSSEPHSQTQNSEKSHFFRIVCTF